MQSWRSLIVPATVAALVLATFAWAQCDSWQPVGTGFSQGVGALTTYNSELIVGGSFHDDPEMHPDYIARWDDASGTWQPLGAGVNGSVISLAVYNGELIAGGWFSHAEGQIVNGIAAWDGTSWHDLDGGMDNPVAEMIVFDGELIASGYISYAGGTPVEHVARWNGTVWQAMGDGGNNDFFTSFAVYEGQLYATISSEILRWNGTAWESFGAGPASTVSSLAVYKGELIAGGYFTGMNAKSANHVARWNGLIWQSLGAGIQPDEGFTQTLAVYNGDLIAGGRFTTAGDQPANSIARWDGQAWHPLGNGMTEGDEGYVNVLTVFNDELIAGGIFDTAGDQPALNIASWNDCDQCLADITEDGEVSVDDLLAVIDLWGTCPLSMPSCPADVHPVFQGNGVVDANDVQVLILSWANSTGCSPPPWICDGDTNFDWVWSIEDLLTILASWGECPPPPPPPCPADIAPPSTAGEGTVNIDDLLMVINAWGPCQ